MNQYPLFEHWYKTSDWILDRCERMPKHIRYTVSGRMINLCLETTELIIEAIYTKEKIALIRQINLNLEKLRIFFRLSHDRGYISHTQYIFVQQEINTAGKMCGGWLKQSAPQPPERETNR